MTIEWETKKKPDSEDVLCVIWSGEDYEFAYWCEGAECWDIPEFGWFEDAKVDRWLELPDGPNEDNSNRG